MNNLIVSQAARLILDAGKAGVTLYLRRLPGQRLEVTDQIPTGRYEWVNVKVFRYQHDITLGELKSDLINAEAQLSRNLRRGAPRVRVRLFEPLHSPEAAAA